MNSQWSLSAKPCTELQCAVVSTHRAAAPGLQSFTRNITFSVESGAANPPKMSSNALNVPKAPASFTRSLWTAASRHGKSPFNVSCGCHLVTANASGPRQRSAGAPNGKLMDNEVPCRSLNAYPPMCSREGKLPSTVKFPRKPTNARAPFPHYILTSSPGTMPPLASANESNTYHVIIQSHTPNYYTHIIEEHN